MNLQCIDLKESWKKLLKCQSIIIPTYIPIYQHSQWQECKVEVEHIWCKLGVHANPGKAKISVAEEVEE